jgi:CHAD domain-containing protein/DNA-binding CsgD family transcriptional regulator
MEIEAKFVVPDRQVYTQLGRLRSLAGYGLTPAGVAPVSDRYFDTLDRRLLAAGYACRLRQEGDALLLTLKGLGGVEGAVHRRDEREVSLPAWDLNPTAWPESAARTLALNLAKGAPLRPLFSLHQRRRRAEVTQGGRRVAELSLDAVRVTVGHQPVPYFELEVELKGDGTEADLAALAAELAGAWGLVPEPRAKFERALALVDASTEGVGLRLSPAERAALELRAAGADLLARRAQVVLFWASGLSTAEIALRTGLSVGRVRFWLREFRKERLGIFHGEANQAAGGPAGIPSTRTPAPLPSVAALTGLPTITDFCRAHGVDLRHARFVAGEALALFNLLKPTHRLPKKRRKLLRQAALLCNIGAAGDPEHPHAAGRDLILAQPLRGISTTDRLALACVIAFQRERVKPEREPTLAALEEKLHSQVLALAALLQVAEALDFSRTRSTTVQAAEGADGPRTELTVGGPQAGMDAQHAAARAGLWYQLFNQEIVFTTVEAELAAAVIRLPDEPAAVPLPAPLFAPLPAPETPTVPPMLPDEAMSEAGRKAMYAHFLKMLANEAGTRLGEDIEALHDMRVSTRRMRAAYRIFADYYAAKAIAPFNKGLRRTGAMLGAVRDLDVLLEKAEAWQTMPPADPADGPLPASEDGDQAAQSGRSLEPLLADWRTRREVARRQMLEYLDSPAYRRLVADFQAFLTTPGAGALPIAAGVPAPYQVRHVAPRLIFTRYEAVRAYEPILDGAPLTTYHALRIDFKRLRYELEFFREVLGPETPDLIKTTVAMQDLLGALQDAYVAEGLIGEFLALQKAKRKKRYAGGELADVEAYLEAQRAAQQTLVQAFPALWAGIIGLNFRRALALAVAAL